jgi:1-acyl-sn-glycerol-3-phosphate acyltransferase
VFLDIVYAVIMFCIKTGIRLMYRIHVEGVDNVPKKGPAVFICNHTSVADSFFIGCFLPRKIYFMAKSTEYASAPVRFFLYLSRTFPVRRYDIDPVSLRNALRVLSFGGLVGIYPEGERTWDGQMLPFRNGTIRFLLAAGVPIIPAGISGAFENQPRWGGKIAGPEVRLSIGRPIHAPKIKGKDQTRQDIQALSDTIRSRISGLTKRPGAA